MRREGQNQGFLLKLQRQTPASENPVWLSRFPVSLGAAGKALSDSHLRDLGCFRVRRARYLI